MIMTNLTTNNSKDNLPDFVYIFSIDNHKDYWKPLLLESIEKMKENNNIQLNDEGYYYDFNIKTAPRTYGKLMDHIVLDPISELEQMFGNYCRAKNINMEKGDKDNIYWFQQYLQGSGFGWHSHNAHWAMVYYVELPEMTEATEFLHFGQFDVKEGDMIFFPTFLNHRSPEIKSNRRKTIISSNFDFAVDREMIQDYGIEHFRNR